RTVYINGGRMFFLGGLLSIFNLSAVFFHLHLVPTRLERTLFSFLSLLPSLKAIIAASEFVSKKFGAKGRCADKLHVIENELSARFRTLSFVEPRFERGLVVAVVGAIAPAKGQDRVFDLAKKFGAVDFHLVGRVDTDV